MEKLTLNQYVVDAFSNEVFKGNPAAVCVVDKALPDNLMRNITKENNLSETAFVFKDGTEYNLRWFTPGGEIDLCGHATLASAYVIMNFYEKNLREISFQTKSGILKVKRVSGIDGDLYEMNMPVYSLISVPVTDEMTAAIGFRPNKAYMGRDLVCIMQDEKEVLVAIPDLDKVKKLKGLLLHITAEGSKYDCITRTFAPKCNVVEDPVCGSGHCHIVSYWANKLKKKDIVAYQASKRSGILYCRMEGDRVILAGKAALFSKGEIYI